MTRKLLLMALRSVEVGGLKSAPWRNASVSEMVPDGNTAWQLKISCLVVGLNSRTMAAVGWLRSVYQSRVMGSRLA